MAAKAHELKGQAVAAFVTLKEGIDPTDALMKELSNHVVKKIGALARPDAILFAGDLPKTRSGKIMRRLLKDIAEGRALGDTTTPGRPQRRRPPQGRLRGEGRLTSGRIAGSEL